MGSCRHSGMENTTTRKVKYRAPWCRSVSGGFGLGTLGNDPCNTKALRPVRFLACIFPRQFRVKERPHPSPSMGPLHPLLFLRELRDTPKFRACASRRCVCCYWADFAVAAILASLAREHFAWPAVILANKKGLTENRQPLNLDIWEDV